MLAYIIYYQYIFLSIYIDIFFFFNDTATTEIYTLSLHDALPICEPPPNLACSMRGGIRSSGCPFFESKVQSRSEEHTSELQSQSNLVCRLLLEKKKKKMISHLSNSCSMM